MKLCQMIAAETLRTHAVHYHGSIESDFEILENYKGLKGTFIKKFLIGDQFNMNRWRTTWEAIKKDVWDFVGRPIVLTPDLDHPRVAKQDNYKVGEIVEVGLDELQRIAWEVAHITDKNAIKLIRAKKVRFGSPTVLPYSEATTDIVKLGDGSLETTLHRFIPAHDAIVGNPAYTKEVDKIKAICTGDGPACALKLLEVSASLDADINDDNTEQLTIVPFVQKALKKKFTVETLALIVNSASKQNDCVSRKISIINDEHPGWAHDKIVAIAYSYCREKSGQLEDDIIGNLVAEISELRDKTGQIELVAQIVQLGDKMKKFHYRV